MNSTVIVTGDLIEQVNLASTGPGPNCLGNAIPELNVERRGEAWNPSCLVEAACADLQADLQISRAGSACGQLFVAWEQFLRDRNVSTRADEREEKRVWRIRRHLGIANPDERRSASTDLDVTSPDVLFINDLGLGFRNNPSEWPAALKAGEPKSIVLNCSAPLFPNRLWEHLLSHHGHRLTVIVSIDRLRSRGAAISAPLSWDLTIEELAREFESGSSSGDLAKARRIIVPLGTDGAASFSRVDCTRGPSDRLTARAGFERCLYDPVHLEGAWEAGRSGFVFDSATLLAAAMVRHELSPGTYPLFIALGRALAASRAAHTAGAGSGDRPDLALAISTVQSTYHPADGTEPAGTYYSAFPHSYLDSLEWRSQPATESNLLRDLIGSERASAIASAVEVVLRGRKVLAAAPQARIGKFFTVDRDETERLHSVRNLIAAYKAHVEDRRPLALAVFGPPGSGKTFMVQEMAADLGGPDAKWLEFNVSQFTNADDLSNALHHVRDAAVKGQMPFVFFDEFDTRELEWLKHFLSPMRDGVFQWKGSEFPVGRAVLVFAGGTKSSFADFDQGETSEEFRTKKGPDFVSRLRGYIDIKDVNPPEAKKPGEVSDHSEASYIVRRALLLRRAIEQQFPQTINRATGEMAVATCLIRAFLLARKYLHGARSLGSIVSMSRLCSGPSFGPSDLPARNLLLMHVTEDFIEKLGEPSLSASELEAVAEACHEGWRQSRVAAGWTWGERDDLQKHHPMLIDYEQLDEQGKQRNRSVARATLAHLFGLGFTLRREVTGVPAVAELSESQRQAFTRAEHDRWLRESLLQGWAGGPSTNPALRLHQDIVPYVRLRGTEKPLDLAFLDATLHKLPELGCSLTGEIRRPSLDDAIALAVRAHWGQRDKRDEPYLLHVFRVMLKQNDETARIAAVLHDCLEDTRVTLPDLRAAGYGDEVCAAVDCLTRRKDEPYDKMIHRVSANALATKVKIADLEDNLDPNRTVENDPDGTARTEKYKAARNRLSEHGDQS
jgi:hypothetical protein